MLYDQLKHKDRIHLRFRVDHITEGGIQVTSKDDRSYTGDILIGADGIHSSVRLEMRPDCRCHRSEILRVRGGREGPMLVSMIFRNPPTRERLAGT